jgi:hypothetical protein
MFCGINLILKKLINIIFNVWFVWNKDKLDNKIEKIYSIGKVENSHFWCSLTKLFKLDKINDLKLVFVGNEKKKFRISWESSWEIWE